MSKIVWKNNELFDEDGRMIQTKLEASWEICPICEGEGGYVNPSIDGHGISMSEWNELGEDFQQNYMSGTYDIQCGLCDGKGRVQIAYELNKDHKDYQAYLDWSRHWDYRVESVWDNLDGYSRSSASYY